MTLPRLFAPSLATLTRWCRAHVHLHLDDCDEVDVTALGRACAEAHGCDDPREDHPAWEAASAAAISWEDGRFKNS